MANQIRRQRYIRTEDAIKVYSANDVDTCWTWHLAQDTIHEPNGKQKGQYTAAFRKILGQSDFRQLDLEYENERVVLTAIDNEQVGKAIQ